MCSVEMYGSCATELDLPSSDLDLVVCGLDRTVDGVPNNQSPLSDPILPTASDGGTESKNSESQPLEPATSGIDSQQHVQNTRPPPQPQMPIMYGHLSLNARR